METIQSGKARVMICGGTEDFGEQGYVYSLVCFYGVFAGFKHCFGTGFLSCDFSWDVCAACVFYFINASVELSVCLVAEKSINNAPVIE